MEGKPVGVCRETPPIAEFALPEEPREGHRLMGRDRTASTAFASSRWTGALAMICP
jgi:hypothetical protein